MNTKMPKSTKSKLLHPLEKNSELQILNKQHIRNDGINVIAYLHSKLQIYSRVAICHSIAVSHN